MSTALNQPEKLQSDAKPEDRSPDQPASESPEEEGECGFCIFMKGGGCKDAFVDWEKYCAKEGEDKKEEVDEKCLQVTFRLMQCMNSNSDYYSPKKLQDLIEEEKDVIQPEKEIANNNQQQDPSL